MTQQIDVTETKTNGTAAALVTVEPDDSRSINAFSSVSAFETSQRMAKALSASSLLPETFRGNVPNCMIAMELANRIGCSVFMICQNMDVIHGRPGLRAKFLIATVNASGRFSPIRYRWQGKPGTDEWGCQAYATDLKSKVPCDGPWITMALVKGEGWLSKSGSKWKTMPEKMFMYRAGAWWTDLYCPEFGMGMGTAEESIDTWGESVASTPIPAGLVPGSARALESALLGGADPVTGEVPLTDEEKRAIAAEESTANAARQPGDD